MHPTHTVRELAECASLLSTKIACLRHEFEKSSERAQLVRLLRALSYKCRQEVLYERLSAAVMSNMVAEALEVQNDE